MYKISEDTFDNKEISAVIRLMSSKKKLSYDANVFHLEKKNSNLSQKKVLSHG